MQDFLGKELGREGEEIGAAFLEKKGFRVLEKNYRCAFGEIDLIVDRRHSRGKTQEREIIFVEVKTRRSTDRISPLELISSTKQRHISRVAQHYLTRKKLKNDDLFSRFALLIVDWSGPSPTCELIDNAFPLVWGY